MPDAVQPDPQRAPLTIADLGERPDELVPEALQSELEDHLIAAARAADAAGHPRRATALRLLADACSLMLDSDNPAQPFRPWWIDPDGHRSTPTIDNFGPDTVAFFADVVDQVKHAELRARLADIVWTCEPRGVLRFADIAIEAYMAAPLDAQGWKLGGRDAWLRAGYLALSLRRVELVETMEQRLLGVFWAEEPPEGTLVGEYAALMFRYGLAVAQHRKIAERLAELGNDLASQGAFAAARDLLVVAADWFHRKGPADRRAELVAGIAQAWHDEANVLLVHTPPFAMAAGDALEKAIQVYRSIPRKHRPALDVDARIAALQIERQDAGERSLAELNQVMSPPTDISDMVSASIERVVGKDEVDALHALATSWSGPKVDQVEQAARESIDRSFFKRLLGSRTTIASDGRIISKVGGRDQETDEARSLMIEMLEQFRFSRQLEVEGAIMPMLDHIAAEHQVNRDTFITLARNSRLVPPDHAQRVGKALHFGFTRDFETALQYLASEMECIARYHLKNAGAVTINTDRDGIQMEMGLSTLVRLPQMEAVFGKDLTFEIKALFCDQDGPNLRNDVAHGLIPDGGGSDIDSVYAWWFMFRLVFRTSPYASRNRRVDAARAQEENNGAE